MDKTLVTLTPTAHFREFPKITLRFDNLQAEFTELMVAVVLMAIFIIGKGKKKTRIRQREEMQRARSGRESKYVTSDHLSLGAMDSVSSS